MSVKFPTWSMTNIFENSVFRPKYESTKLSPFKQKSAKIHKVTQAFTGVNA